MLTLNGTKGKRPVKHTHARPAAFMCVCVCGLVSNDFKQTFKVFKKIITLVSLAFHWRFSRVSGRVANDKSLGKRIKNAVLIKSESKVEH